MFIPKDDPGRPVEVPDGFDQRPAGATVGDDGMVACVVCKTRLRLADADIVGQGYRCPRCTQQASVHSLATGRSDVGAHLDSAQREALHESGVKLAWVGAALVVGGVVVLVVLPAALKGALGGIVGGLAMASLGITRIRAAR